MNAAPASVFGTLGADFIGAYTFDNQTKEWSSYRNPALPDAGISNALGSLAMGNIAPGKGYMIQMAGARTLAVTGNFPTSPSVTLYPGLNLVGFPLPATAPPIIGLQDILSGPLYSFPTAFRWDAPAYSPFRNNGLADDETFLFDQNKALWVESPSQQVWTPQVAQPPLLYVERGGPLVVEAPVAEFSTAVTIPVPVRVTRTFSGKGGFVVTGTAQPETDFSITSITPTNSVGEFTINSTAASYQIPVSIRQKTRIQTNSSVFFTLRRPVESPVVADSGTLPQVAQITITDGMNGIYDAFMEADSDTVALNGQNFRVALRANGTAIFDPGDGGMISGRFTLPYSMSGGVPQFSGNATVSLASASALRRTVTVRVVPGASQSSGGTGSPSFSVPLSLTFQNLTAAGPFQTTAKVTFVQASPAL